MIRPFSFGCFAVAACFAHGQEQAGIAHSNFAGTDAVTLNPARMSGQWSWMDLNILGADAFAWNDHVYVSGRSRSVLGEMRESIRTSDGDRFVFNESLEPGGRHAFVLARVKGPALALSMGKNSFGVSVSGRSAVTLTGVGNDLARFAYNGLGYAPQHGIRYDNDRLSVVGAAWTEIGVSYARQLVARDFHRLSAGITAKYLMGHAGGGVAFSSFAYTVLDTSAAVIHEASGRYGFATPAPHAGHGAGFDVGVSYERTLEEADGYVPHSSCDPLSYRYRIGFSLIDLGGMRFPEATSGTFDGSAGQLDDYTDIEVDGEQDIDSLITHTLEGFQSTTGMRVGLPTAASVQFDQRIADHLYVAASVVQNLAFGSGLRLRRPNTVSIVPRFELRRAEVALPVTFHEYRIARPDLGVMVRVNNLVLGSDNVLPLITRGSLYGSDVYFRLKWTIFRGPACRGKKCASRRPGDLGAIPCNMPK